MDGVILAAIMVAHVFDLGMAVVAGGNNIIGPGFHDLVKLYLSIGPSLFCVAGLEGTSAPAAAEVVGPVGDHVDEIFFPHNGFDDKSKIIDYVVAFYFPCDVAGVLHCKFNFKVPVPVGVDL